MKFEVEVNDRTIRDLKEALVLQDETLITASEIDVIVELFYLDTCDARGVVKVKLIPESKLGPMERQELIQSLGRPK